jgi:hypothetical protein
MGDVSIVNVSPRDYERPHAAGSAGEEGGYLPRARSTKLS